MKEHKFFERHLNNDLNSLAFQLQQRYNLIQKAELKGTTELNEKDFWVSSGSISTVKWREYNVFQFHIPEVYNIYKAVADMMKEACAYYDINFEEQKYMIQGWFNINEKESGKLDWHDHGEPGVFAPHFHGYYCINAEPSITHYKLFNDENKIVDNINKNNRSILSEMGHPHAQGDWSWGGKRITLAYDIIPLRFLPTNPEAEQHWIPLI
jgi:hypothetical protein